MSNMTNLSRTSPVSFKLSTVFRKDLNWQSDIAWSFDAISRTAAQISRLQLATIYLASSRWLWNISSVLGTFNLIVIFFRVIEIIPSPFTYNTNPLKQATTGWSVPLGFNKNTVDSRFSIFRSAFVPTTRKSPTWSIINTVNALFSRL